MQKFVLLSEIRKLFDQTFVNVGRFTKYKYKHLLGWSLTFIMYFVGTESTYWIYLRLSMVIFILHSTRRSSHRKQKAFFDIIIVVQYYDDDVRLQRRPGVMQLRVSRQHTVKL